MPDALETGTAQTALRKMDKVIVAIHGVGNQQRSETIRSVASRFSTHSNTKVALMPLGYFYVEEVGEVKVSRLDVPSGDTLEKVGFAEVFWADIPRKIDKDEDTLEDIKAWGRTVVSRAEATYDKVDPGKRGAKRADFQLGAAVIDEIVETVGVMENLLFVLNKMGLFKFDLAPVLREYVGDVQVVAEFKFFRERIVHRFHQTMRDVLKACGAEAPEIYIVAHSEGTVVSFLAMLQALSGSPHADPDHPGKPELAISTDWIDSVRGYMTIGSPIDKHLILWPQMWKGLQPSQRKLAAGSRSIQWRNYYDYGDPIGFRLETAAQFLKEQQCEAFGFDAQPGQDDFGFSRYLLPGKAHIDYWDDDDVFNHFIQSVVLEKKKPPPPPNRAGVGVISTLLPYFLSAGLHVAAVFLLLKALAVYFALDKAPASAPPAATFAMGVLSLSALLMGVTCAARVPRLVRSKWKWLFSPYVLAAALAGVYWIGLPDEFANALTGGFAYLLAKFSLPPLDGRLFLLALAVAMSLWSGLLVKRQTRWGKRSLIAVGAATVAALVLLQIATSNSDNDLWPVLLAGAAFLYLWWLGILVFDLAFIWHRYIRQSVAIDVLRCWHKKQEAKPMEIFSKPEAAPEKKTA